MPEPEATTAPTLGAPALPLHDSSITGATAAPPLDALALPFHNIVVASETRLHHPTLANQVCNPDAASWAPEAQYIEIFAGVGSLLIATEARGGEIATCAYRERARRGKEPVTSLSEREDHRRHR